MSIRVQIEDDGSGVIIDTDAGGQITCGWCNGECVDPDSPDRDCGSCSGRGWHQDELVLETADSIPELRAAVLDLSIDGEIEREDAARLLAEIDAECGMPQPRDATADFLERVRGLS